MRHGAPRGQRGARGPTADRAAAVRAMFTRIAARYDLMNALMTAGRHHAWRRHVAAAASEAPPGPILDLATGTGDLALAIRATDATRVVVGADFADAMLAQARLKLARAGAPTLPLVAADALDLPFAAGSFACVTSAFLLRNLAHLERGLGEMLRVTRPRGRLVTLDIMRPGIRGWDALFALYFHRLVPVIGGLVAGDRRAYTYLPESVERFVTPDELTRLIEKVGWRRVAYRRFALGTIVLHTAVA